MRTYSSESNVLVIRVQQESKLNVFSKDLKIILFVMEQCKYLCCQTILMKESRQHSGNILYKGKTTSNSFIR